MHRCFLWITTLTSLTRHASRKLVYKASKFSIKVIQALSLFEDGPNSKQYLSLATTESFTLRSGWKQVVRPQRL